MSKKKAQKKRKTPREIPVTFALLAKSLRDVMRRVPRGEIMQGDPSSSATLWSQTSCEEVTRIVRSAFALLAQVERVGHRKAAKFRVRIEDSYRRTLGYEASETGYLFKCNLLNDNFEASETWDRLDSVANAVLKTLKDATLEFPIAALRRSTPSERNGTGHVGAKTKKKGSASKSKHKRIVYKNGVFHGPKKLWPLSSCAQVLWELLPKKQSEGVLEYKSIHLAEGSGTARQAIREARRQLKKAFTKVFKHRKLEYDDFYYTERTVGYRCIRDVPVSFPKTSPSKNNTTT